ncbi:ATP-binding domain-containing protein [Cellulosimicrobium sp. I38E]|uniref:HelD family protein n=1 Tax=Cellulosimicrobium sp. I38E TaxID=1393139 RepID=UPI000A83D99C|nr:ATP-binding domain-containing protein [Cellulosimicrobium sp. I38E]
MPVQPSPSLPDTDHHDHRGPATHAVAEEQQHLDAALARRSQLLAELDAQLALPADPDRPGAEDVVERSRRAGLRRRRTELERAESGLVFGRVDAVDGVTRHVGRVGIAAPDADADPLVLDWRAPGARAFYTATAREPQGLARRRHVRTAGDRVTGVDDEPLAGSARGPDGEDGLVGEGALLAALSERRTGRMGTAVATLQVEQDAIVRAPAEQTLVVQGGPGTGKTVVALHRVAYLLFTHPHLAERGVLLLGPSPRFLEYVAQVLPALGETAVVSATCDTLVPGVAPERGEDRDVAELKGRALWQDVVARYADSLVPDARALTVRLDGEPLTLDAARVGQVLRAARAGGRSVLAARRRAVDLLLDALVDEAAARHAELLERVEEGYEDVLGKLDAGLAARDDRAPTTGARGGDVDGELTEDDLERLRGDLAREAGFAAVVDAWWPVADARAALADLLGDAALLARHAPELSPDEVRRVVGEPAALAPSDVPLLDALADALGTPDAPGEQGEFLTQRASTRRDWVYGHVVVDEAQELSPMQWHMVLRRCPTRSVTAVGDVDQTEAPHRHTDWADVVGPVFGDRWHRADLTICYRTPREVMELVGPVLRAAGSRNAPPRAVRDAGVEPRDVVVPAGTAGAALGTAVAAEVARLAERYDGGSVGVVAPRQRLAHLGAAVRGVPVLSTSEAKGLEWDAVVVVDPDGIAAEPRGWNGLYVAMTRCTQELARVTVGAPSGRV